MFKVETTNTVTEALFNPSLWLMFNFDGRNMLSVLTNVELYGICRQGKYLQICQPKSQT